MSTGLTSILRNYNSPFFRLGSSDRLFDSVFDSLFDSPFYSVASSRQSGILPRYNVTQNDKNYEISVAAPGVDKNDIEVNIDSNTLTISYNQEEHTDNSFACSSFSRSWRLPEGTEADNITATYDKGILTLSVPTADATASIRKIEIK